MGMQKRWQAENDAKLDIAAKIAANKNIIKICSGCNEHVDLHGDITDTYKEAANLFKNKDPSLDCFSSQKDLTDSIKKVCESAGERCGCKTLDDY